MKQITLFLFFLPLSAMSQKICKEIEVKVDKFSGDTTFRTPPKDGFTFIRVKSKGRVKNYLMKREASPTLVSADKGFFIVFENGVKYENPEQEIKTTVSGANYVYSAFFEMNDEVLELFRQNIMTDSKVYIHDSPVIAGKQIKELVGCLVAK